MGVSDSTTKRFVDLHRQEAELKAQLAELSKKKRAVGEALRNEMLTNCIQSMKLTHDSNRYTVFLRTQVFAKLREDSSPDKLHAAIRSSSDPSVREIISERLDSRALTRAVRDIIEADKIQDHEELIACVDLTDTTDIAVRSA